MLGLPTVELDEPRPPVVPELYDGRVAGLPTAELLAEPLPPVEPEAYRPIPEAV